MILTLKTYKLYFSLIAIFISYFLFSWWLSIPLTGDQKIYSGIAMEMYFDRDFIIPHFLNQSNFLKPPFQYWVTSLSYLVFGFSVAAAVLPQIIAVLLCCYLIFKIEKVIDRPTEGVSSLVFAGTLGTMVYGTTIQMEIWIVVFFLLSWLFFLETKNILSMVIVGVMAWVKGPLYPALWVFSVVLYSPKLTIKNKRWYLVLLIGVAVGLLWFAAAAMSHPAEVMKTFFFQENLSKASVSHGTLTSLWGEFFFSLVPVLFIFLLSVKQIKLSRFEFYYLLIPSLFFSIFPYKVNTYLYILTPIISMQVGRWITLKPSLNPKLFYMLKALVLIFFSLIILTVLFLLNTKWMTEATAIAALCVSIGLIWTYYKEKFYAYLWFSLIFVNIIRVFAAQLGQHEVNALKEMLGSPNNDSIKIAYWVSEGERTWSEYGWLATALQKRIYPVEGVLLNHQRLNQLLEQWDYVIYDTKNYDTKSFETYDPKVSKDCHEWKRLAKRTSLKFKDWIKNPPAFDNPEVNRVFQVCKKKID